MRDLQPGGNGQLEKVIISNDYPVVISKFISGAKEIEVDAVANNGNLELWAALEHMRTLESVWGRASFCPQKHQLRPNALLLNTRKSPNWKLMVLSISAYRKKQRTESD